MLQRTQFALREGEIHLGIGHPQERLLPRELLREAALHRLSQQDPGFLQYGADAGDDYFRLELARFLCQHYGFPVTAKSLFITNGISQALDFVCRYLSQPGDSIFIEEPSYFLALPIFADYQLKPIPVPVDADGLVIDALEALLKRHKARLLYTIPSHQNPSGISLSQERREALLALAQKHNFVILADEVYHLLSYHSKPPQAMAAFTETKQVISFGSFSKILAPGLRLGWLQAHESLLSQLSKSGMVQSGGGLNPFSSAVVHSALELGLQNSHLENLKVSYAQRLKTMSSALKALPVSFHEPQGGYFFWLKLHDSIDTSQLLEAAIKQGLSFQPGSRFSSKQGLANYLRLCFSYYDSEYLIEGIQRLHKAMNTM